MTAVLRIGNCSGFYGDRISALREMLEGGPLDVLTGDYLAELTMSILAGARPTPAIETPPTVTLPAAAGASSRLVHCAGTRAFASSARMTPRDVMVR